MNALDRQPGPRVHEASMRALALSSIVLLPLAPGAGCHDGAGSDATPPTRSSPAPLDASPSLAEPPPNPTPTPAEPAPAQAAPKPAREPDRTRSDDGAAPPAPPRPIAADPQCAEAERLLAAGDQAMAGGDPSLGRNYYHELIKNHPICPQVPYVYLAFGDFYFVEGRIPEAKQFYQKVAQFAEPAVVAFATYKMAWCALNETDARAALEHFVKVVSLAERNPQIQPALRDAAIRDSLFAYADVGEPRKAAAFYRRIAGDAAQATLTKLAAIYTERGQRDRATIVCESAPGACK